MVMESIQFLKQERGKLNFGTNSSKVVNNSLNLQAQGNLSQSPVSQNKLQDIQRDELDKKLNNKSNRKLTSNQEKCLIAVTSTIYAIAYCQLFLKRKVFKPANFAEHIDFVKANTMKEAVAFARKHLGIKKFNLEDDLELANWVNEGLVNINNRFKGKANMPKTIKFYSDFTGSLVVAHSFFLKDIIEFNKEFFLKNNSAEIIRDVRGKLESLFSFEGNELINHKIVPGEDFKVREKLFQNYQKMLKNPKEYTRFDAILGGYLFEDYMESIKFAHTAPKTILNILQKNKKAMEVLEKNNINISMTEFDKFDEITKNKFMDRIYNIIYNNKIFISGHSQHRGNSIFYILNHEMGHLLHFKNISIWDRVLGKVSRVEKDKFVKDIEKQEMARKISSYASSNPLEFVAETFSVMLSGVKLPEKVIEMYKAFGGPNIPKT